MKMKRLSSDISKKYRAGDFSLPTQDHLETYRRVRMPATKAAIRRVLHEIRHLPIQTLLDLGAGPGTGWCAAKEVFPSLASATFVEKDRRWETPYEQATWVWADLSKLPVLEKHDLVLLSYAIGEIPEKYWDKIVETGFSLSTQAFVILEPGTPQGSARIVALREKLLNLGAHILAPCPHAKPCPMPWCHFSVRLSRTSEHRKAKGGTLGYEDEKFSYLIVSKTPHPSADRLVRSPLIRSGHVQCTVCTSEGQIKNITITKSQGEIYKQSKKLELGSVVIFNQT